MFAGDIGDRCACVSCVHAGRGFGVEGTHAAFLRHGFGDAMKSAIGALRFGGASAVLLLSSSADASWTVARLLAPGTFESHAYAVCEGFQVGHVATQIEFRASMWSGTAESWVELHPVGAKWSQAFGASATSQVGWAKFTNGGYHHAMVWHGTRESGVDLHPEGMMMSVALGAWAQRQGGYAIRPDGTIHAGVWSGTAASWVDLHPPAFTDSVIISMSESVLGGMVVENGALRACKWVGPSATWMDLHPAGASASQVRAVWETTLVGEAMFGGVYHAGMWTGGANTWVDLHPQGVTSSQAFGISADSQVGQIEKDGKLEAVMWYGSVDSMINLHETLDPIYTYSSARSVWSSGGWTTVAGYGFNSARGCEEALLWTLGCRADFDGTGFVDTEDYTAFVLAFEMGEESADFDMTGFVDVDDFGAFVAAFENGC